MGAARQAWLAAHPWLAPVASFQEVVDAPFPAGAAAEEILGGLVARVAAAELPAPLSERARALGDALRSAEDRRAAIARVVAGELGTEPHAGLLQLLAWAAVRHAGGGAAVAGLRGHGDGDGEHRPTCPTCGAAPVMAQLATRGEGRGRLLACGRCRTRWAWRRTGCPFCGNEAPDRLLVLEIEGDERLRLDACVDCHGYLKTYAGEGEEELFLADWPTLHLDVLARERGLERRGASLYEI